VIAVALALTWVPIAGEPYLPKLFLNRTQTTAASRYVGELVLIPCALALLLLWLRGRTVLDVWLMVVMCGCLSQGIIQVNNPARFSLAM
jgi:hypothetical protein